MRAKGTATSDHAFNNFWDIAALPAGLHGLANIAGLPPTKSPEAVLKVNLVGLKYLTTRLLPKLADGASIVNLASLAGLGWA